MTRWKFPYLSLTMAVLFFAGMAFAQSDPGVRGGGAAAGGPLASVAANNPAGSLAFFNDALATFREVDSVSGTVAGEDGSGLGPRFNSRSCASCHAQPATGGSSPATNPQVTDASADGARNTVPSFITSTGPVREVRFPFFFNSAGNPDVNNPNGGVEDLFTITGRVDGGTCNLTQPSFAQAQSTGNIIFRIPTPTFGAGLVENIDDSTLLTNAANNSGAFGTSGAFNHNGNDGTISRFGWKAQNKSLLIFSGEAYNVEQGVSNEAFTQERPLPGEDQTTGLPANCRINGTPEDHTQFNQTALGTSSDVVKFSMFMRLSAPPAPSTTTPGGSTSISAGRSLFSSIGCSSCHTPSLATSASSLTPGLGSVTANLFSDLEVHHMGTGLNDNVSQGGAGGDQFRSSPLWGLGQRIFFLHDGRTANLLTAIAQHASSGSEANNVIANFNALSATNKQNLLNFLRSL
ncbi:MAG TPA: di-heme oxidoredictase family protein [Candidatus Angelobacter sp.]|nr:di-heme oxidoredictase family protein [Candidatus Angelobacter sp.]